MTASEILLVLETVTDPEIPVLTISDLGILKDVTYDEQIGKVIVHITPTYNGCPAMDMITVNIRSALEEYGLKNVEVISSLDPAWTTDWITAEGRSKLLEYGIAPPAEKSDDTSFITGRSPIVQCPQCKSLNTALISRFGSTACKALYKCNDCLEPFDYFKCH
jgi:ring-1,2-phenylacetyl-CoA epoxidase subunit PaaD